MKHKLQLNIKFDGCKSIDVKTVMAKSARFAACGQWFAAYIHSSMAPSGEYVYKSFTRRELVS